MPSLPTQNSPPSSYHHAIGRGELLILLAAKRGGGNYDLLYQVSIRIYEDDLEHKLMYIL